MIQTSAAKYRTSRAVHYAQARQAWRKSKPYLELDDCTITADEAPSPCPPGRKIDGGAGIVERRGVVVVVPSPWISRRANKRAAAFWRSMGFEERRPENSPHLVEGYVREWVRFCDAPLNGETFTAAAWLAAAQRKHKEFYHG
jgi:hypothetical protein